MRRHILAAAGALALSAALPSLAAAQAVRGVTDTEIVIGTYTDLSGVTVSWGVNNSNAIRLAFDEVNAKGGIHGRRIRYIVEDNQYQVPRSIQAANKLINRDNVFLLIANGGTPMNNAVMPTSWPRACRTCSRSPRRGRCTTPTTASSSASPPRTTTRCAPR
jgi:branched-chain amino acid transport system substrate-binding protein